MYVKAYLIYINMRNIFFAITKQRLLTAAVSVTTLISSCSGQGQVVFKVQDNPNTLLWEISGNGLRHPSFLFGTFHLMCKDEIAFSPQLLQALKLADKLYLELDMDDPAMLFGAMKYMNMQNGKQLRDFYTSEEFERLQNYFKENLHTPLAMFQKAKPYFLVALLYPQMLQCSPPASIEEALVQKARENKIEVKGLETVEQQAAVFDSIPYDWQAKELLKNIDSMQEYQHEFETMLGQYRNQDLAELEGMASKSEFGGDNYADLLINDRNKNWVEQLDTLMKSQSLLVAVGAGHLVGKQGLISLLKQRGYTLQPLVNKVEPESKTALAH